MGKNLMAGSNRRNRKKTERAMSRKRQLERRISELQAQVRRLAMENENLRAARPARKPRIDDAAYIAACRIACWAENSRVTEYWDDEAKDYAYPGGWPEGVDPDAYVAERLGRDLADARTEAQSDRTLLHEFLNG